MIFHHLRDIISSVDELVVVTHPEPINLEARPIVHDAVPEGETALAYYHEGRLLARGVVSNEAVKAIKSELNFSVDEDTGKTVVRVIDKQSGTLIRQMPSQEMLEIAKALDRLQGLLVRNSA